MNLHSIDVGVTRDGSVVCVVLDIQSNQRHKPALESAQVPYIVLGVVEIDFQSDAAAEHDRQLEVVAHGGE